MKALTDAQAADMIQFFGRFDQTGGAQFQQRAQYGALRQHGDVSAHQGPGAALQQEVSAADLWALSDLCTPWCVHVVATLRIANHIDAGIDEIDKLALTARCNPDVLHSVLGHLVSRGVFEEPRSGPIRIERYRARSPRSRAALGPGS